MTSYIPPDLRALVEQRAGFRCEYCLMPEASTFFGCQVDHVIAEKHGGLTIADNLALACVYCNRFKGSDIGSIDEVSGDFVRFYNPRLDHWDEHFKTEGLLINGLSASGRATSRILRINAINRIEERELISYNGTTWPP